MIEGKVEIFLSYKEPENKHLLWLRPHIGICAEGYDLLYFGAKGWVPLLHPPHPKPKPKPCPCPPPPAPPCPPKGDCCEPVMPVDCMCEEDNEPKPYL